jgi:hypothetical protein
MAIERLTLLKLWISQRPQIRIAIRDQRLLQLSLSPLFQEAVALCVATLVWAFGIEPTVNQG